MHPVRALLDREHQRTLRRLSGLTNDFDEVVAASRDTNADDEHDPGGATIAFERSQISAFVRQARIQLTEVEAALQRLEDGSYGVCERCAEPIAPGRLEARPLARTCVGCACRDGRPPGPEIGELTSSRWHFPPHPNRPRTPPASSRPSSTSTPTS